MAKMQLLTREEIDQRFDLERYYTNYILLYYMYYEILYPQITRVLFFDGDTNIKGNLDADWIIAQLKKLNEDASLDFVLILINGNLTVEGDICIGQHYLPLIVLGNAHCDVLINSYDYIDITGNAHIKYVFYGYYNRGSINVDGNAYVPYVLHDNYSSRLYTHPSAPEGAVFISLDYPDNRDTIKYDYTRADLADVIIPAAFDGEGNVEPEKFIEIVRSGKSPFIDGKIIVTIRSLEKQINHEGWRIDFTPVAIQEIREVEGQYAFAFPDDYIEFITNYGLIDLTDIQYGNLICDMLHPALIKRIGDLVIFQKFDVEEDPDFYAFQSTGTTTAVVSYFDKGAVIRPVAQTFTEHIEMLLKSIVDGSYRIKYTPDIPYNKEAYDAEEQRQAAWNKMVTDFQKKKH